MEGVSGAASRLYLFLSEGATFSVSWLIVLKKSQHRTLFSYEVPREPAHDQGLLGWGVRWAETPS